MRIWFLCVIRFHFIHYTHFMEKLANHSLFKQIVLHSITNSMKNINNHADGVFYVNAYMLQRRSLSLSLCLFMFVGIFSHQNEFPIHSVFAFNGKSIAFRRIETNNDERNIPWLRQIKMLVDKFQKFCVFYWLISSAFGKFLLSSSILRDLFISKSLIILKCFSCGKRWYLIFRQIIHNKFLSSLYVRRLTHSTFILWFYATQKWYEIVVGMKMETIFLMSGDGPSDSICLFDELCVWSNQKNTFV